MSIIPPLSEREIRRYYEPRLADPHKVGKELRAPCPLHRGTRDSFSINLETGEWYCHSECNRGGSIFKFEAELSGIDDKTAYVEVLRIIGREKVKRQIVAVYDYLSEGGEPLYQTVRYNPKDFRQRRPDGNGGWIWNLKGVRLVLYDLPAVLAAPIVFVCEGEKDAKALKQLGVVATTNAMGAGKWLPQYSQSLRGKEVIVIPDADPKGRKHAADIVGSLAGIAQSVKLIELPGAKDAALWIAKGGTKETLVSLVEAAPIGLPTNPRPAECAQGPQKIIKEDNPEADSAPTLPQWPEPIQPEGFHGIAGELIKLLEPHTEADPAALLLQFLIGWGNLIQRGAYYLAEADRHHANEYVVIVGATSKARKGSSWGRIRGILAAIDEHWTKNRLLSGLGSGEALIEALGEEENDRRTLIIEAEFSRLLAVMGREGSTLSANMRDGWDTGTLSIRTRQKKVHVAGAHLSFIGHITREELLRRLSDTEMANGFGNRILWICARRSRVLPHGGGMLETGDLVERLTRATFDARAMGNTRLKFDETACQIWEDIYGNLSDGKPGLFGAITSRAEAHVVRLALTYALLDGAKAIRSEHLRAGLALWRYSEDSARYIWGDSLGDPTADELLSTLRISPAGLTRWEVTNYFGRNKSAAELDRAFGMLAERGLIRSEKEDTGGRTTTRYWKV
jgi:hypothetical protein